MNNIIIENTRTKDIRPPPCEIEYKNMKFLITDRPTDQTIQNYIQGMEKVNSRFMLTLLWGRNVKHLPLLAFLPQQIGPWLQELKKHKVRDVVRVCEPTYKVEELNTEGISVTDLAYDDGTYPPSEVVEEWFELLKKRFKEEPEACVAVHCVAGLGRAPVLVALALIELGMRYEDAVELIRTKRRGAINTKQLQFLEKYRPKSRLKLRNGHKNSCSIQ